MILQLIKMGGELSREKEFSDLENHRLRLHFTDKSGARIYGDVCCWDTSSWQASIKKHDKNYKYIDIPKFAIGPDLSYYTKYHIKGKEYVGCFRYGDLDISVKSYPYTKAGLLEYINSLSKDTYTDIEFISRDNLEEWNKWHSEDEKKLLESLENR